MAIRGPQGPRPEPAAPSIGREGARDQPQSPLQRLQDFGSAKTPQEAQKLLKEILTLLAAAGFPVTPQKAPEQQLSATLKQLQKQEGLPQTGQLDQKTFEALDRLGLLPKKEATESVDQKTTKSSASETKFQIGGPRLGSDFAAPRGGSEVPAGTQKTRSVETEQARARVDSNKVEVQVDLKEMLNSLKSAGFVGAGKGKEQLQDAVKKLQRVDGLPPTGQLDQKTAESLERRGVIDKPTAQALKEQDPRWVAAQSSSSSPSSAQAETSARSSSSAQSAANENKGTPRGDPFHPADAPQGQGGSDGASAGKGKTGGEGTGIDAGASGTTGNGDVDGLSDDIGNNYAGDDDDDDARRGRANVDHDDDRDDDDAGHWEVKKLALQLEAALQQIVRDSEGNGPATYAWDVRLHRPGIYSARQPAEELLHVVVTRAGPFDGVWQQALSAVNEKLRRYEPEAPAVDDAALRLALQRARYRLG